MRCIANSVLVVAILSKISCYGVVEAVQWVNVYPDKINIVKGSISDENVNLLRTNVLKGAVDDPSTQIDFTPQAKTKFLGKFIFQPPPNLNLVAVSKIRFEVNGKVQALENQKWKFQIRNVAKRKWQSLSKTSTTTNVDRWGMWKRVTPIQSLDDYINGKGDIVIRLISNNDFDEIGIDYMNLSLGIEEALPTPSPPAPSPPTVISKGDSFVYDLPGKQSTYDKQVIFIDLFDTNKKDIASIRSMGKVVICYFSAGSLEDWRSDKSAFPKNAVGNALGEWPGEFWLDIMNDDVRTIMKARMDLAKNKGCHGVDPDNVDGFDNDTGFSILKWQTKDYIQFLASQAHERGLLIGLKNSAEIATQVEQYFDFAVVEECWEYNECCQYISFGTQMKPVFAIEYRSVKQKLCAKFENNGFSTNFANYALDQIWFCPEETRHLDASVSDKESSRKLAFCSASRRLRRTSTISIGSGMSFMLAYLLAM
eukprot:CAMPEP_0194095822 /NCGR_PEP_ID=MMETSP0149-20130528/57026_1 /TAXON_ID=122233 /ORGANISM="Chaetoceros debilis, Strain MM31A-1" /LENGTH=480 /DNA_ID=CAMNT_0038781781 /DNA_START=129 /DNA_END=1571 /DNA_ORIENTATION=-